MLGMQLKKLRIEKKYTLKQLSKITGLSIGFISQVERGLTDPSLSSLKNLADAFEVKLQELFQEENPVHIHIKKDERSVLRIDPKVYCELLAASLDRIMDPMIKFVEPGGKSGLIKEHEGEEFILVLSGTLQVTLGGEKHLLDEGDSLYFQSNQVHEWENIGDKECQVLWVMTPPSYS